MSKAELAKIIVERELRLASLRLICGKAEAGSAATSKAEVMREAQKATMWNRVAILSKLVEEADLRREVLGAQDYEDIKREMIARTKKPFAISTLYREPYCEILKGFDANDDLHAARCRAAMRLTHEDMLIQITRLGVECAQCRSDIRDSASTTPVISWDEEDRLRAERTYEWPIKGN